jgi:hypothetical protein
MALSDTLLISSRKKRQSPPPPPFRKVELHACAASPRPQGRHAAQAPSPSARPPVTERSSRAARYGTTAAACAKFLAGRVLGISLLTHASSLTPSTTLLCRRPRCFFLLLAAHAIDLARSRRRRAMDARGALLLLCTAVVAVLLSPAAAASGNLSDEGTPRAVFLRTFFSISVPAGARRCADRLVRFSLFSGGADGRQGGAAGPRPRPRRLAPRHLRRRQPLQLERGLLPPRPTLQAVRTPLITNLSSCRARRHGRRSR